MSASRPAASTSGRPRRRINPAFRLPLAAAIVEIAAALVLGPRSCDGGLDLYFYLGIASGLTCLAAPWLRKPRVLPGRWTVIGGMISVVAWFGGAFLGQFRVICKLF